MRTLEDKLSKATSSLFPIKFGLKIFETDLVIEI